MVYCAECFNALLTKDPDAKIDRAVVVLNGQGYCVQHYCELAQIEPTDENKRIFFQAIYKCEFQYVAGTKFNG